MGIVCTTAWFFALLSLLGENPSTIDIAVFLLCLPCLLIAVFRLNCTFADPKGTRLRVETIEGGRYEIIEKQDMYVLVDDFGQKIEFGRVNKEEIS